MSKNNPTPRSTAVAVAVPEIENVAGKISVIERRIDHLKRKLQRADYSSTPSAEFDRAEIPALEAGVKALRYVETVN